MRARIVPLISYLISNLVMWLAAALTGLSYWNPLDRWRWDAKLYLSIAADGYESYRCHTRFPELPDVWCGNTAWFPGYPTVIRAVASLGLPYDFAAILVSEAFFLGSLFILWKLFDQQLTWQSGAAMAAAAVFPGAIYFHAIFGTSMCLFGLLLTVYAVRKQSWTLAALGSFLAFSTHMVGVIGVIALGLSVAFGWRSFAWPQRILRVGGATAIGALALPWTLWKIHAETGSWTIYWEHQRDAFNTGGLYNPITEIGGFWAADFAGMHPPTIHNNWLVDNSIWAHQSQLVINLAFLLLVVVTAIIRLRKHDLSAWEGVALLIAMGSVGMPLVAGAWTAWYRHNAMMLVALPLLRLPKWGWVTMIAIFAAQAILLAAMWFGGSLI
jgi:hypothetical protein